MYPALKAVTVNAQVIEPGKSERTLDLEALMVASEILGNAAGQLCTGPTPVFAVVSHAQSFINKRIAKMLRGDD